MSNPVSSKPSPVDSDADLVAAAARHASRGSGEGAGTTQATKSASLARVGVLLSCAVFVVLSVRGIQSEGTVSLQGDMPRYLMNGVYFHDLLRDLPVTDFMGYTYRYFARYPALSLGHHPLLLGLAEAPFFWLFGISVSSARLAVIFLMLLGVAAWFQLVRSVYGELVALVATLLLVTTPYVIGLSQVVMSEVPTLALVLVSTYFLHRYCESLGRRDGIAFAVAAVLSCYAKQLAVLMFPVFLAYFLVRRGVRALLRRDVLVGAVVMAVLLAPLVPMTFTFSRLNVRWVSSSSSGSRFEAANLWYYPGALWRQHVTPPLLLAACVSLLAACVRRDRRVVLFLLWVLGFYVQITYMAAHDPRFAIYWIPPFCLFAASALAFTRSRAATTVAATVLAAIVMYQFVVSYQREPAYADGYEAAARYVTQNHKGESVLYSAKVDSGYFVFFVRKHDPHQGRVVLRADKTLVTSGMGGIVAERLTAREQIHQLLRDYGTAYVVIEDTSYWSPPLELLRQELNGDEFTLRARIPIRSNDKRLLGVDLAVYEYNGYHPSDPDKMLQMDIPLMRGQISVRFGDLLPQGTGAQRAPHE